MAGLLTCDKLLLKFLDYIHCLLFQTKHNIPASWGRIPCWVVNSCWYSRGVGCCHLHGLCNPRRDSSV